MMTTGGDSPAATAAGDYNKDVGGVKTMKGAATNTDGNDGDNEVKLRAAKTASRGGCEQQSWREQRAGCSSAAQPQGGRFPLRASEITERRHMRASTRLLCCETDDNHRATTKVKPDGTFNPQRGV